jgi:hypothetical protein
LTFVEEFPHRLIIASKQITARTNDKHDTTKLTQNHGTISDTMIIPTPAKESVWTLMCAAAAVLLFAIPVSSMPRSTWQESILFWACLLNIILWGIVVILRFYSFVTQKPKDADRSAEE